MAEEKSNLEILAEYTSSCSSVDAFARLPVFRRAKAGCEVGVK